MRMLLSVVGAVIGAIILLTAGILIFDAPAPPQSMASIEDAFAGMSFAQLPPESRFVARDGTRLVYRAYPGNPAIRVVLVHGSSGNSASMHFVAEAIQRRGATVYALSMRGHDGTGRSGDIDYIGQLDNDLVDFMRSLPQARKGDQRVLVGFSSGGGFALRFAGGPYGRLFNRFVLISPELPVGAPTWRRGGVTRWVSVATPRIVTLAILSRLGIRWFDGLDVLAFAVPPKMRHIQTAFYSYRMMRNFGPDAHYLTDLSRAPGPVMLLVGSRDEMFRPGAFAPLLKPVRPNLTITIIPGVDHMGMITKPTSLRAIAVAAVP